MNIILKTINGWEYKIPVSKDETCAQLKDKIQSLYDFTPNEQVLIFQGTELPNDKSKLTTYGIKNESVIYLALKLKDFTVVVARQDSRTIDMTVSKENTIQSLKENIQTSWNRPIEQQTLLFKNVILENNKKLSDYGIVKECLISFIPKVSNNIPVITCKTIDGKTYAISIDLNKNAKCLKEKIYDVTGLLPDEQQLIFQGMILEDNKALFSSQILDKSVVIIATKSRNSRLIFCETLYGKISLHVNGKETIRQVKGRIADILEIKIENVIYNDTVLNDRLSVDEYEILERSVINVTGS